MARSLPMIWQLVSLALAAAGSRQAIGAGKVAAGVDHGRPGGGSGVSSVTAVSMRFGVPSLDLTCPLNYDRLIPAK